MYHDVCIISVDKFHVVGLPAHYSEGPTLRKSVIMVGIQLGLTLTSLGFRKSTCRVRPGLLGYGYGLRLVLGFVLWLWLWQTFGVTDVNHFLQLH